MIRYVALPTRSGWRVFNTVTRRATGIPFRTEHHAWDYANQHSADMERDPVRWQRMLDMGVLTRNPYA